MSQPHNDFNDHRDPIATAHDTIVFQTPWFAIATRSLIGDDRPYYIMLVPDFVVVIARDRQGRWLLVEQERPAVGRRTWEWASGHVETARGETPEQAARRELVEETGHDIDDDHLIPLGSFHPDTGRLANRMWCYLALDAAPVDPHDPRLAGREELDLRRVMWDGSLAQLLQRPEFACGSHLGVVALAATQGRVTLT
jgi:8-oxo-dGTP pyrophosphatase MutT (NUDIX family)